MAAKGLPTARDRRRMLAEASPQLRQAARDFLAQGRQAEALECLEASPDAALLEQVLGAAIEAGDLLLFKRTASLLGRAAQSGELLRLAEAAQAQGKLAFAAQARALAAS